jgi:UDP-galactopyranose mutase
MFDYCIIGGGPCGLSLAWCLTKYNKKVIIIDKNNEIGGCHRVKRINGLFVEHGPRIYLDNYMMFKKILKEMDLNFYDIFTPYHFDLTNIGGKTIKNLSSNEIFKLGLKFFNLNDEYKKITMEKYLDDNNFSDQAKNYIDRLCRLTDGAGIDKYTLFSFLQLLNQNFFYKVYQPKKPTDTGLFYNWKNKLLEKNVKIVLNTTVIDMDSNNDKINSVICNNNNKLFKIKAKEYVFAIPPYNINNILINSKNDKIKNAFGDLDTFSKWTKETNYLKYINVIFHWDKKFILDKIWGFPSTSWGLGYIALTDYMNFDDERSKVVISCVITKNIKSEATNKTPNETKIKKEFINEVLRQLRISYPNLPNPTYSIMEQNYHDGKEWIPHDTAFVKTKYGYMTNKSNFKNLYNCGVHNGNNKYSFTSFESAINNSISLLHDLIPESKIDYEIQNSVELLTVLKITIFLIIVIIVIVYKKYYLY